MNSLVYRHNWITRLTHWVNTLGLLILLMSGLQIFNAYPHLHWGSKAEPEEAFFSIYATSEDGEIRGYTQFYGRRIETTGFFGVQSTEMGVSPRAFPSWLTIPGYFWLAGGRRWHFFFAWVFVLNGLLYFLYNVATGHLRKFLLAPKDTSKLFPMILYYLRIRRESPQEDEYNPLQKMAYTGVFFILTPLIILSGLAMSPQMDVAFNWLPAMFGGRQSARSFHFLSTFLFALFTFGHIFMVLTTGLLNNMRSMVTGWYMEKIALLKSEKNELAGEAEAEAVAEEPIVQMEKLSEAQFEKPDTETKIDAAPTLEEPVKETPISMEPPAKKANVETKKEGPGNGEK